MTTLVDLIYGIFQEARAIGATLEALIAAFCRLDKSLTSSKEKGWLVGAVGIELKATLKIRKLFIPLDGKNAKNSGFAQPRYTRGTRPSNTLLSSRLWPTDASRFVVRGRFLYTLPSIW